MNRFKGNKELSESARVSTSYTDGVALLTIKDSLFTDEAWYRCEASNKLGKVETHCDLTVQSKFRKSVH